MTDHDAQAQDPAADPVHEDPAPVPPPAPTDELPTGPVRATISKGYRIRLLVIGLGLLVWTGLSLKDGLLTYPKEQAIYNDLQAFKEQHDDWQSRWTEYALEKGYSKKHAENPNKVKSRAEFDTPSQFVMAGLCGPVGLYFLVGGLLAGRRWVEGDPNGVRNHKGVNLTWDQVNAIEDDRWKTKGIAYLRYDAQGGEGRLLLDDWKFDREATGAIYKLAVANVNPETQEIQETQETQENRL